MPGYIVNEYEFREKDKTPDLKEMELVKDAENKSSELENDNTVRADSIARSKGPIRTSEGWMPAI